MATINNQDDVGSAFMKFAFDVEVAEGGQDVDILSALGAAPTQCPNCADKEKGGLFEGM